MAQVSLYVEDEIYQTVVLEAKKQKLSVSRFVTDTLRSKLTSEWPAEFWNSFGAIKDETFIRQDQLSFSDDAS
jgi:hypothetical protein